MNVRGVGDLYAVPRLTWLVVGLVVVPTLLLFLYGLWALQNQRAASADAARQAREAQLQEAATSVFLEIARIDAEVYRQSARCGQGCLTDVQGVAHVWSWRTDSLPPQALAAIGVTTPSGEQTVWHATSPPVGVTRGNGQVFAWELDLPHLEAHVTTATHNQLPLGALLELEEATPGPATPLEEMAARWEAPLPDGIQLEHPLARWRLVLRWPDGEPRRPQAPVVLAAAGLALLLTLAMSGAVATLVSATREIRLSRLQTDFVSNVSHELRTPLTSIRLFVETLQSGRLQDEEQVEECLDLLAHETDRLSRLIERVLNWARMEAGRRTYEFEEAAVSELFEDALFALASQRLLMDTGDVHVVHADPDVRVRVDRDAIVEALVNLLQNAVKYCPAPRHIVLGAEVRSGRVGLTVTDDGPGIPQRDRRRIFEKFYQSDLRLSAPRQLGANRGSGLGLAIVNAVARGHDGSVELHSELGRGSRFTLWLPTASTPRGNLG